jgi:hypothetical protein
MKRKLILVALTLLSIRSFATAGYPYEWEKNRSRYTLTAQEEKMAEIILKDHIEYAYTFENDQFLMYTIVHRIVRVNNAEAIQRHNRITISLAKTIELVEVKARSINPQNKVVTLDKGSLKEVKEEGSENGEKIFAVEGVEAGSEIEYYFIRKMSSILYSSVFLQMDVPIRKVSFTLRCPKHLEFDLKVYNGQDQAKKSSTETENVYEVALENLPALRDEPFAYYRAAKARVEFKLAYNTAKSKARLYTWDEAAKDFYTPIYKVEKEEEKNLEKFVKELRDDSTKPMTERIRLIERKIKSTVQLDEHANSSSLNNVGSITKSKVASKFGIARLFGQVFQALNIESQLVITCNREYSQFDESFDTWTFLDDYFFYFPATKGFLSPYNQSINYPIIEPEFTSQKALFIEPIQLGAIKSGLAAIDEIPAAPYSWNLDNLDITISFNNDLSGNEVNLKRKFKGYNASFVAPYYHLMTEQEKLTMIDNLLKQTSPGIVVKKWNAQPDFSKDVDEFNIDVDFTSSHFVERAGPRLLFKAGLLIGPQTELYTDDQRILRIENGYNRGYERILKITIPDGYLIRNPGDLNFSVLYKDGDKVPFSFESTYKLDGQQLTVTILEYYKEIYAPLNRYEDFRKVINAAADFNKVTLVLEKKK